jgi:cyclic-di-GMP-binding biofilm dispersal mediator protein
VRQDEHRSTCRRADALAACGYVTDLDGRSILVAGASGGLGAPIARRLSAAGARLTLVGRDASRLQALGLDATIVTADLRKAASAATVVGKAVEAHGALDGVVMAAGVVAFGPAVETPDDVLVDVFTLNTLAPIRLLRASAGHLAASAAAGHEPFFCTISAVVAEQPMAGMAGYSASKAALTAFDAAAGRELRRSRIRVLDARPPHTETGLADRPVFGQAPRLAEGLSPDAVADRIVAAIVNDERDLPSHAFG